MMMRVSRWHRVWGGIVALWAVVLGLVALWYLSLLNHPEESVGDLVRTVGLIWAGTSVGLLVLVDGLVWAARGVRGKDPHGRL